MTIIPNCLFLGNIGQENVFYDILKSPKIDILPKGLTHALVQKWPLFHLSFLGNIGQENVFYDILEKKNAFLGYKNKKFQNQNN